MKTLDQVFIQIGVQVGRQVERQVDDRVWYHAMRQVGRQVSSVSIRVKYQVWDPAFGSSIRSGIR